MYMQRHRPLHHTHRYKSQCNLGHKILGLPILRSMQSSQTPRAAYCQPRYVPHVLSLTARTIIRPTQARSAHTRHFTAIHGLSTLYMSNGERCSILLSEADRPRAGRGRSAVLTCTGAEQIYAVSIWSGGEACGTRDGRERGSEVRLLQGWLLRRTVCCSTQKAMATDAWHVAGRPPCWRGIASGGSPDGFPRLTARARPSHRARRQREDAPFFSCDCLIFDKSPQSGRRERRKKLLFVDERLRGPSGGRARPW